MINFQKNLPSILMLVVLVGIFGCKSTEQTTTDADDGTPQEESTELDSERQQMLDRTRSQLSDLYVSQKQDIPEAFLEADSSNEQTNRNPYDGYRIQILSTRDVEQADSVASNFRAWADSTIAGYQAEAYQSFRQPHYRVHIGDFQQREQANAFSRLIKNKYPDAWVVHDRIEPSEVPADTANFEIKKPKPLKADTLNSGTDE